MSDIQIVRYFFRSKLSSDRFWPNAAHATGSFGSIPAGLGRLLSTHRALQS